MTHCPALLLPGLSANQPSMSSKIIPCISHEDDKWHGVTRLEHLVRIPACTDS